MESDTFNNNERLTMFKFIPLSILSAGLGSSAKGAGSGDREMSRSEIGKLAGEKSFRDDVFAGAQVPLVSFATSTSFNGPDIMQVFSGRSTVPDMDAHDLPLAVG